MARDIEYGSGEYIQERARFRSCFNKAVDAGINNEKAIATCDPTYLIGTDVETIITRKTDSQEG